MNILKMVLNNFFNKHSIINYTTILIVLMFMFFSKKAFSDSPETLTLTDVITLKMKDSSEPIEKFKAIIDYVNALDQEKFKSIIDDCNAKDIELLLFKRLEEIYAKFSDKDKNSDEFRKILKLLSDLLKKFEDLKPQNEKMLTVAKKFVSEIIVDSLLKGITSNNIISLHETLSIFAIKEEIDKATKELEKFSEEQQPKIKAKLEAIKSVTEEIINDIKQKVAAIKKQFLEILK